MNAEKLREYIEDLLDPNGAYVATDPSVVRKWAFGAILFARHAEFINKEEQKAIYAEYFGEEGV